MKERKDKCGPAGDGWGARLISRLIPDRVTIRGTVIDFSSCCDEHDIDNTDNGANKEGDEALKECLRCRLMNAEGVHKVEAIFISSVYYVGVRFGNPFYKGFSEVKRDFKDECKRLLDKIAKLLGQ